MNMPKHTRAASSNHRYNPIAVSNPMATSLAPSASINVGYSTRPSLPLNTAFFSTMPTQAPAMQQQPSYDPYQGAAAAAAAVPVPPSMPHRPSSGAWTPQDDNNLIQARQQGLNWAQIQTTYFPGKTGNACRKRHERLMERKGVDDWDALKLERIAREYIAMRKEIWTPLATAVGEKWAVVEAKCMGNGIKNLQAAARHSARRERAESSSSGLNGAAAAAAHHHGYGPADDDSGISGIGLTPVDDLDASYSSPETAVSAASASSHGSAAAGGHSSSFGTTPATAMHPSYYSSHHSAAAYGGGGSNGGYSTSLPSGGTYGSLAGHHHQHQQHHQQHHHHQQQHASYMTNGQRLPSVDMGIDAIMNRNAPSM